MLRNKHWIFDRETGWSCSEFCTTHNYWPILSIIVQRAIFRTITHSPKHRHRFLHPKSRDVRVNFPPLFDSFVHGFGTEESPTSLTRPKPLSGGTYWAGSMSAFSGIAMSGGRVTANSSRIVPPKGGPNGRQTHAVIPDGTAPSLRLPSR